VSLSAADVAEIMRLVEQSSFDELTLEMDGLKLTLRRAGASGAIIKTLAPLPDSPEGAAQSAAQIAAQSAAKPDAADPRATGLYDIASPMLGTFYRAPKPGSAPFVEIGSVVAEDSVIGIIEVMKLMNIVRAGTRGTISAILPADGALVEFGEVLMRVRKDA
jgi:acetyl-CoA carboxylase biotin carboxyl carrier protein